MKNFLSARYLPQFLHRAGMPFIRENSRIIIRFLFTVFFIGLGIWFIRHEQTEMMEVRNVLVSASVSWVVAGVLFTCIYIVLQGFMYVSSFRVVGKKVDLYEAVILFLKRNLVSIFLPAGGISSLAFFSRDIEKKGISKTQIHFASSVYAFIGIVSVVVVAVPAFLYALSVGGVSNGEWLGLSGVFLVIALLTGIYRSLRRQGVAFKLLIKWVPSSEILIREILSNQIDVKMIWVTLGYSVLIELAGIAHLYIAMQALHAEASLFPAVMGYTVSVIFLIISPFLRGLGALEISMAFILTRFGYSSIEAVSITFLYRFLEFWLPLLAGLISFMARAGKLLMRILPALVLLILGMINIVSVLTPAIGTRVRILERYLPGEAITISNYFVLASGLFLLVTAAFMLKGLRITWYFAMFLSVVSLIGNLSKAIDYEESIAAVLVIVILFVSRKEYYIKENPHLRKIGLRATVFSMVLVLLYGITGFYFLDKHHFGIDFNFGQSVRYTFLNYFLIDINSLVPLDSFAKNFLYSINISGFVSICFLIYTLVRPYVVKDTLSAEDMELARELVSTCGKSAMDYFKTYPDKIIYRPAELNAFLAYRIWGNFAVVLENPVARNETDMKQCIAMFDQFSRECGLKNFYYRVPQESLPVYEALGRKNLFLGQEGVVNLDTFSLEGGAKKSMRNALKKVTDKGFKAVVYPAPVKDGLLQRIKAVSDEWLSEAGRHELVFSQGMFIWEELKNQTIITVESPEEKIVAFVNIIPDYAPGEGTYDLIRKTADAPNGVMDFIMVEMFHYLKSAGYTSVNLGLAPMSGIDAAESLPEKSMKFAYEKIRSFSHYKGLRDFKEKFAPVWHNKYLIYSDDYDLIQAPSVLNHIIKP
ncbi:hypothetical protein DYBT9275_05812 [Dyadobacter sp. CECT 9275]|uniref:Phosphatidylglycerol lysyltransferase n=1 Tax=Dyadobacter helix TaxID=2822344 RepID=A0A916NE59_9BACT|nr:phosphatidylglycerol lysyltransferase domain-containing protein [Dyadobacter sp. CECT 9275]CAG5017624.1 hypothetical protein DYBT9275_05812 [Dyadobacter sp. CECT 9275]